MSETKVQFNRYSGEKSHSDPDLAMRSESFLQLKGRLLINEKYGNLRIPIDKLLFGYPRSFVDD